MSEFISSNEINCKGKAIMKTHLSVFSISAKKISRALAMALVIGANTFGQTAFAETTLEKIKRTGTMVAGTSAAYAPFEFRQGDTLVGFDIDLGREIAKRMGVEIEWVEIEFKGIIAGLKSGRADLLITAMTKTPERAEQIDFSTSYYNSGDGAAVPEDSDIAAKEDLVGKVVGVQIGSSGERFARGMKGITEIKSYDTILLALKDLENGRSDAVVNSLPSIKYSVRGMKGLKVLDPWSFSEVGINTRKEDAELLEVINKHLADLKHEGFLDNLDAKWF